MPRVIRVLLAFVSTSFRSRLSMQLELVALRHQISLYKQSGSRPKIQAPDRFCWAWLSRLWPGWQRALEFVQPRTVIAWQNKRFRDYWSCRCTVRVKSRDLSKSVGKARLIRLSRSLIRFYGFRACGMARADALSAWG